MWTWDDVHVSLLRHFHIYVIVEVYKYYDHAIPMKVIQEDTKL
jgi:hypothetical protein